MESRYMDLPPLKRFRLMQQHQQQTDDLKPSTGNGTATTSCLPAKKRKECRYSPSPPPPPPVFAAATTLSLPAKKRIWAFQPFDLDLDLNLNLEYKSQTDDKPAQIQTDEINNEDEKHYTDEDSETRDDGGGGEDGIVCAVCDSTDGDPTDPIVLCDGCDLMVHATCYGHPFTNGIPEGDWFCAQCLDSRSEKDPTSKPPQSCCLCPVSGGALKPTTDGRWAHLVCAIYVPEVFFVDSEGREGINCDLVLKRRWGNKCCICKSKNGCVIDCSEPRCGLGFHVSCGLKEELCIEYREREGKKKKKKGAVVAAFCRPHTDLWKKQEQTGKFRIVARDEERK